MLIICFHSLAWFPCPLYLWVRILAQSSLGVTYLVRGWHFLFKCKMNEKLVTIHRIEHIEATMEEEAVIWHVSNRFLVSRNVNFIVTLLFEFAAVFGLFIAQVQDPNMNNWIMSTVCNQFPIEVLAGWLVTLLQVFLALALVANSTIKGMYLKSEFLSVFVLTGISAGLSALLEVTRNSYPIAGDLILLLWGNLLFIISVAIPLYFSYKFALNPDPQFSFESLESLLSDPEGYNAFYRFLQDEFSTENLLFYSAVKRFKEIVDTHHHRHLKTLQDQAYKVYKTFLVPGAAYEVNVPQSARIAVQQGILKKFRRHSAIESKVIDSKVSETRTANATPEISPRRLKKKGGPGSPRDVSSGFLIPADADMQPNSPPTRSPRVVRGASCPTFNFNEPPDMNHRTSPIVAEQAEAPKGAKEVNADEVTAFRSIFDVPQQFVYHLMRTDSFGRFVLTKAYKQLLLNKVPSLKNLTRKIPARVSISEEIKLFSVDQAEEEVIEDLLDRKQDIRIKKPRWKAKTPTRTPRNLDDFQFPTSSTLPPSSSYLGTETSRLTTLDESISGLSRARSPTTDTAFTPPPMDVLREGGTPRESIEFQEIDDEEPMGKPKIMEQEQKQLTQNEETIAMMPIQINQKNSQSGPLKTRSITHHSSNSSSTQSAAESAAESSNTMISRSSSIKEVAESHSNTIISRNSEGEKNNNKNNNANIRRGSV